METQLLPVDEETMNYAGPLMGAVILGVLIHWAAGGRKLFQVPVKPMMKE